MAYRQAHHEYARVTPFDGAEAIERGARIGTAAVSAVRGGVKAKGEMDDQARKKALMDDLAAHEKKWSGGGEVGATPAETQAAGAQKKGYTVEELMRMTGNKKRSMSI